MADGFSCEVISAWFIGTEALVIMGITGRSCRKQDKMSQFCINDDKID